MITLHLDENMNSAAASALRRLDIDVTTTRECELDGSDDLEQLAHATSRGRAMITNDEDFIRLHRTGIQHCGIIYYRQSKYTIGQTVHKLARLVLSFEENYI